MLRPTEVMLKERKLLFSCSLCCFLSAQFVAWSVVAVLLSLVFVVLFLFSSFCCSALFFFVVDLFCAAARMEF